MQKVSRLIESFTPDHYDLSLTLNRSERTFHGIVTIHGESHQADTLRLHAKEISIESATIDGRAAAISLHDNDEVKLQLGGLPADSHTVVVAFSGMITDHMHGLYPCYFEHDGVKKELLATQFESHHAREVFPCVDEPEAKATFDVTLTTETDVTVLGNMPVIAQNEEHDMLVTRFATSPRMSSYLLAWVVGDLHRKTALTKSGVEVNVWATPAQPAESLDFALDIATRSIEFYDEYFKTPYPLPKSDHVALPDFSSGAMENWGLITYREVALLAHPTSTGVSSKHYIATVIAHELAHQWFGNLVTMKWWNDLWLNESFATVMEYIAIDALEPDWNVWLDFASNESIMALRRDAIDGVQAVQVDVNHPDEISTLFDSAIVYAKGARLLRMLEVYIGKDAFRDGLRAYFAAFSYRNTEANDLWNAFSKASGKDITELMNAWISQPGYPVVTMGDDTIEQTQFYIGDHTPSGAIWPIPLRPSDNSAPALLDSPSAPMHPSDSLRLNSDDSAHFITHYPVDRLARFVEQLPALQPVTRLQLLHEQTLLARGGIVSSATLVPLIRAYKSESIESVWDILGLAIGELKKFVEDDVTSEDALKKLAGDLARSQYTRLGWDEQDGEAETDTKLRATILGLMLYSEDEAVLAEAEQRFHIDTLATLAAETRALLISSAVRHHETPALVETLLSIYQTTQSGDLQQDIVAGLTSTRQASTAQRLLELTKDSTVIRTQDAFRWFVYLVRNRYTRSTSWQWLQANWSWVKVTFSGDKSYDDYPRYAATGLVTAEQLDEYRAFFGPMKQEPALTRTIALGENEIAARVALIAHDSDAVRRALVED